MYKISIVTVAYNCVSVIEDTILSIVSQTYPNKEYILIDGNSQDGTMDVVYRYKSNINYLLSERDNGIYDAMNKGLQHATGDYVIFMNAGDTFCNESVIERFVAHIDNDTVVAHGNIMKVAKRYRYIVKPSPLEEMGRHMANKHQASFVRLDYHKSHPFDASFRSSGDYDFFYKAYYRDKVKFQYIPVTVANFDCIEGTSNSNFKKSYWEDLRIWGKEDDIIFKLKLAIKLEIMSLKIWIKRRILSEAKSDALEINRLRKENVVLIITEQ